MTIAIGTAASKSGSNVMARQGNSTVDCSGAQIRAYLHHLATVVTVRGEIDAVNVNQISAYIRRFTLGTNPVVVDMSELSHFSAAGISLLCILDEDCRAAGVEWKLVTSPAVTEQLALGADTQQAQDGNGAMFPTTRSVHEALRNLADAIARRRQLVLPLIKKAN
ncbi:STAS domain-containing protein [Mycobacterium decipiens]|uniref:STAS domain-containing protein n=1 Tax=Mycobacterium decipiens TaxID=1430326 RepID=A0A1X2LZF7_9MYCO|nr:STAS domain-containing protein [Mycobacterium decipiens]OSC42593.1 STAS domain-containing protein [Mycobacterium decipiens]